MGGGSFFFPLLVTRFLEGFFNEMAFLLSLIVDTADAEGGDHVQVGGEGEVDYCLSPSGFFSPENFVLGAPQKVRYFISSGATLRT